MDIQYRYFWDGIYSYFPSGPEFLVEFIQVAEYSVSLAKGLELEAYRWRLYKNKVLLIRP